MNKYVVKPYEELTFSSDFLFCKILESRPDLCKALVELIFSRNVKEIRNVRAQMPLKASLRGKGVRFDIIFEDDESIVYDFEMQTTDARNLPKRTRYYQAALDTSFLEQGQDYEMLPQSYIVFICTFNPFSTGRHLYTFESRCSEDSDICLGDGAKKVFLCTEGTMDDISPEAGEFLDFVSGRGVKGKLAVELEKEVEAALIKEEWRAEYMQNMAVIMDAKREGRAEGRKELASAVRRLQAGETMDDLVESGVDRETAEIAVTLSSPLSGE